jgi:hypothetical protein
MNTLKKIDKSYLAGIVHTATTFKSVLITLGLAPVYTNYKRLKYYLNRYGIDYSHIKRPNFNGIEFDEDALRKTIRDSYTLREVLIKMGVSDHSAMYRKLHKAMLEYHIDGAHLLNSSEHTKLMYKTGRLKEIPNEQMFVANSNIARNTVKTRILRDNLIPYVCGKCGNPPDWFGNKLVLILDHINGVNNDHRLNNLRFLCPNCNSTLPTHCRGSKGIHRKVDIDKRKLYFDKVRTNYNLLQQKYVPLVLSSGIDFTKFGWVKEVAKIINIPEQKVNKWMKRFLLDFYMTQCFKRKNLQA